MIASDDGLTKYLGTVLTQISDWMEQGSLQKLVLVISSLSSSEASSAAGRPHHTEWLLRRPQQCRSARRYPACCPIHAGSREVDLRHQARGGQGRGPRRHERQAREGDPVGNRRRVAELGAKQPPPSDAAPLGCHQLLSPHAAIIRQITASVTFLPLIEEACSFDLLVYADKHAEVPKTWEDSDPRCCCRRKSLCPTAWSPRGAAVATDMRTPPPPQVHYRLGGGQAAVLQHQSAPGRVNGGLQARGIKHLARYPASLCMLRVCVAPFSSPVSHHHLLVFLPNLLQDAGPRTPLRHP